MLRFPTLEERGEGVITEVLGPRGKPGVDTLPIIRAFGLRDQFPPDVLQESREAAAGWGKKGVGSYFESTFASSEMTPDPFFLDGREDFTGETVITIDPVD